MIGRFLGAVLLALAVFTLATATYYWISFSIGGSVLHEDLVIYRQYARSREVEIDGRTVEQRYYEVEAEPPMRRWELILPAILLNNLLLLVGLSALAVWYARRISGPVHRMSFEIARVLAGEYGIRVRLRRNDEFQELAGLINRLIIRIEEENRE